MIILNHDTPDIKTNKSAVWFITILFAVIYFPFVKNSLVSVLLKLYELFVQHEIGR